MRAKTTIRYNKWQLVGFSFSSKAAKMFVGNQQVADSENAGGDVFSRGKTQYQGAMFPRQVANRATDKFMLKSEQNQSKSERVK